MNFTIDNLEQALGELSVEQKEKVIHLLNRPFVQKQLYGEKPKQKKEKKEKKEKKLETGRVQIKLAVGDDDAVKIEYLQGADIINFLMKTTNSTKSKGTKSLATKRLHELGIKRSWGTNHLYQVRHSQDCGSIKLVNKQFLDVEGDKLNPHSLSSIQHYITQLKRVKAQETQGRGYLLAGLKVLEAIHINFGN